MRRHTARAQVGLPSWRERVVALRSRLRRGRTASAGAVVPVPARSFLRTADVPGLPVVQSWVDTTALLAGVEALAARTDRILTSADSFHAPHPLPDPFFTRPDAFLTWIHSAPASSVFDHAPVES